MRVSPLGSTGASPQQLFSIALIISPLPEGCRELEHDFLPEKQRVEELEAMGSLKPGGGSSITAQAPPPLQPSCSELHLVSSRVQKAPHDIQRQNGSPPIRDESVCVLPPLASSGTSHNTPVSKRLEMDKNEESH
ncbi:hypothetical protein Q5P01_021754 [Channa striata]|uniref:Uncharacterized protein n=1 Tax=Channa striata TaxID=64152 RepID=A0AA88LUM5_CHASR|nr:hypothetical protein Q5P01_021754 [Channa striata]